MEGNNCPSNKLRFKESKKKFRISQNFTSTKKLIASANNHGLILIACGDQTIKAVSIDPLDFQDKPEIVNLTQFQFIKQLTFIPTLITVARYGYSSVLLVCGKNKISQCPVVEAIDLDTQDSIGQQELPELADSEIIDYAWHPNYYDSIICICTNRGCLLTLGISRKVKCVNVLFNDPLYGALTCCWSPKGKNLAIGMANGKILRLEPVITADNFSYKEVDKSLLTFNHIKQDHQVTKLRWINRTFLMSVHSRPENPAGPETVYSLITVKPGKPYLYWSNLIFENRTTPNYTVHLVNLSNAVICVSNGSGEVGVIGVEEANRSELNDWHSMILDEGVRIDLPLDGNNRETYPLGVTTAVLRNSTIDQPIVIIYNSDGVICPYLATHDDNILKLPEFQQPQECPVILKAPPPQQQPPQQQTSIFSAFSLPQWGSCPNQATHDENMLSFQEFRQLPATPVATAAPPLSTPVPKPFPNPVSNPVSKPFPDPIANPVPKPFPDPIANPVPNPLSNPLPNPVLKPIPNLVPKPIPKPIHQETVQSSSHSEPECRQLVTMMNHGLMVEEMEAIKKKIEFNDVFITLLEEVNTIRENLDEVQDIHKLHHEVIRAVNEDIDLLDIGMLENLYLIEYIKTRSRSRKKSVHPLIYKKVEEIKVKSKLLAGKLRELENHVEASWEEFVRRNALDIKNRKINSVDIIYKLLANNQRVIKAFKEKLVDQSGKEPSASPVSSLDDSGYLSMVVPKVDQATIRAFREYLSARGVAPVRKCYPR